VLEFDYKDLDAETRIVVQQHTSEIKSLMRSTIEGVIAIGHKLTNVKAHLGHGNFRTWLELEFDWSVKTATRFMQVSKNFKSDNLTHLNIAVSALYLLASPSISEDVRKEVLQRAKQGENITYSKAKAIVAEHKKAVRAKDTSSVNCNLLVGSSESESNKSILKSQDEDFTRLELNIQTCLESSQDTLKLVESKKQYLGSTEQRNGERLNNSTPIALNVISDAKACEEIPHTMIQLEMGIKKLTPEQVALVITNSAKNGLSNSHLRAIIIAAQKALTQDIEVEYTYIQSDSSSE
jgi:hypothetical protein